VELAKGLY